MSMRLSNSEARDGFFEISVNAHLWGATEIPKFNGSKTVVNFQAIPIKPSDNASFHVDLTSSLLNIRCIQGDEEELAKIDAEEEAKAAKEKAEASQPRPRPKQ